jgi:hypothetical protein
LPELPLEPAPALALEAPLDWAALPPLVVEATVTGALALTGAFTEAAAAVVADPTWIVPTDWVAACDGADSPSSAAAVPVPAPSAINAAPNAKRRCMIVLLPSFERFRRASRPAAVLRPERPLAGPIEQGENRRRSFQVHDRPEPSAQRGSRQHE